MLKRYALSLSLMIAMLMPVMASALDFRSVSVARAVLYDAPSVTANKTYILSEGYPVEVIVDLGAWLKVRDAQGGLNWIETKQLSKKRTLLVKQATDIKKSAEENAAKVASVEKDVLLDFVASQANNPWVLVKHASGVQGYVPSIMVWGL